MKLQPGDLVATTRGFGIAQFRHKDSGGVWRIERLHVDGEWGHLDVWGWGLRVGAWTFAGPIALERRFNDVPQTIFRSGDR